MVGKPCSFCGASNSTAEYDGKRYCPRCWSKRPVLVKGERSTVTLDGDIARITTARGEQILADAEDAERISRYSWCLNSCGYPVACIQNRTVKLSRFVLEQYRPLGLWDRIVCQNRQDVRKATLRIV